MSAIAAIFLSSAIEGNKNISIGSKAPEIKSISGEKLIDFEKSDKFVISFWNPKNPSSRISNKRLSDLYADDMNSDTRFISICTDSDEILMKEVMNFDNISTNNMISYSMIDPRVLKDYGVENGAGVFSISGKGKIEKITR